MYTPPRVQCTASRKPPYSMGSSVLYSVTTQKAGMLGEGKEAAQEEGNICIRVGDLCGFIAEADTTL